MNKEKHDFFLHSNEVNHLTSSLKKYVFYN